MNARKMTLTALVSLCALGGLLALVCSPAIALKVHVYGSSFGSSGTGSGQFEEPVGVAVSDVEGSVGEVYVVDRNNNRVEIFSSTGTTVLGEFNGSAAPTGKFEHPEWIAVDNSSNPLDPSAGDVYVTDAGHKAIDKFSATGTYEGQITTGASSAPFSELYGVAVDSSGVVWVYQSSREIDSYSDGATNEFLSSRLSEFGTSPGFAVDSQNHLFANRGSGNVAEIDSAGKKLIEEMDAESSSAVAVDIPVGNVYVDNVNSVAVFSPAPSCTVSQPCGSSPASSSVERFGSGHLVGGSGVTVSSSSGTVYVADRSTNAVAIFPRVVLPDVTTAQPTNVQGDGSATLNGTVTPDGLPLSSCTFEYGLEASYGNSVPCEQTPAEIGSGTAAVPVSVHITGLTPDTRYHYRLTAADANGENHGEDAQFTILAPPSVEIEISSKVGASIATVSARINPGGALTKYDVEYGTSQQYGSTTPEVSIGNGLQSAAVQVQLSGLQAGALYYFRFVARSVIGTVHGEDKTFSTTQSVATVPLTLSDNRVYELVSSSTDNKNMYDPVTGKNPQLDTYSTQPFRSAADGNAVTYLGEPPAEGGNGAVGQGLGNQYLARRGATSWSAGDITPVGSDASTEYEFFSSDLSVGIFVSPVEAGALGRCYYLSARTSGDGSAKALSSTTPTAENCELPNSAGASADGSHLLFAGGGIQTVGAKRGKTEGEDNLYDSVGGQVHMVNILPDGQPQPTANASFGAPPFEGEAHPNVGNVISADGSRIFWSSTEAGVRKPSPKALYVRENDTQPQSPLGTGGECTIAADACTVQVDAGQSQCVAEGKCAGGGGVFWTASSDGGTVLFTDCNRLTADSTSVPGNECIRKEGFAGQDLYEYDVNAGVLTDFTVDHNSGDPLGADVQGVVGASKDGSYVYFVAGGALAAGASPRSCVHPEGGGQELEEERGGLLPARHGCNLYVRHDGTTTFIGTLLAADNNLEPLFGAEAAPRGDWRAGLGERTAEVTPDGHGLVFTSTRSFTGYNSKGLREVFVYDALKGKLSCASCDPGGAPPVGDQSIFYLELGGYLPTSFNETFMERFISSDGGKVFFETDQPLLPRDTNGLQDVYEWERNGEGSCSGVAAGAPEPGCVYLLSGGESSAAAYLIDSDASGQNVFFTSRGRLIPEVHNENVAVYDARVNGGFPSLSLACSGTGCQGVPPAPPIFATPSSATFSGVGNFPLATHPTVKQRIKPKQCKRGFARRRGKCVKKKVRKNAKRSSMRSEKRRKR